MLEVSLFNVTDACKCETKYITTVLCACSLTHMWNLAMFSPTVQVVLFLPACLNAPITISPNSYNNNGHLIQGIRACVVN